jgi:hypothetical protein
VHVTVVVYDPAFPQTVAWVFDQNVNDPTSSVADLSVNNLPGASWARIGLNSLRIEYGSPVAGGQPWSVTEGAGGITGVVDGGVIIAASGTVLAE